MIHLLASQTSLSWYWLWHPLQGPGYQFWSGIGSDIAEITLISALLAGFYKTYRHLECHVESPKACHRIGHLVPGTGHRACTKHHPHSDERGSGKITEKSIRECHEVSRAH